MQPPNDAGFDWWHGVIGLFGGLVGAASGFVAGVWRLARIEPNMKAEFEVNMNAAEQRVEKKIEEAEQRCETKVDGLAVQYHEAFSGIRQKINDVELNTERRFLSADFRQEHREDMKRIMQRLDALFPRNGNGG